MLYSNKVNPVALPPGRARLSTKPAPTGSTACANTIGTVRVAACNAATVGLDVARRTSGESAISSAAYLRYRSASPEAQRMSICRFRPLAQPNCCNPCRNPAMRIGPSGSFAPTDCSTPIRRMRLGCCARAANGRLAAAPPSPVMNSRRFMPALQRSESIAVRAQYLKDIGASGMKYVWARADVRSGSRVKLGSGGGCQSGLFYPQQPRHSPLERTRPFGARKRHKHRSK